MKTDSIRKLLALILALCCAASLPIMAGAEDAAVPTVDMATVTTKTVGSGTVTGGGIYTIGTDVTLTAAPDEGAGFIGWYDKNGTLLGRNRTYTWTLAGNTTITAKFGVVITAVGSSTGMVSGSGNYEVGTAVTLTAYPATGYQFEGWYTIDNQLLSNQVSYTFSATESLTAYARFTKAEEEPNTSADPNAAVVTVKTVGSGTVSGDGTYTKGTTVTLVAKPSAGYVFIGWYDRLDVFLGGETTYSWTVAGNTTVTAKFGVTLTVVGSSTGTVSGGGTYTVGDTVTLQATPKTGYYFTGWYTSDGTLISQKATCPCKVSAGGTIIGMFSGDPFYDVRAGEWYTESVAESVERNLITGKTALTFDPDSGLTRAQVVTVLARMEDVDTTKSPACGFRDVSQSAWYAGAVNWAYANGIVSGISSDQFGPDQPVSRQDFMVMLMRFLKNVEGIEPPMAEKAFTDQADISSYAVDAVRQGVGLSLLSGYEDGSFRPKRTLLRKEGVKVLVLLDKQLHSSEPEPDDPPSTEPDPLPETVTLTDAEHGLKLTVYETEMGAITVNTDPKSETCFIYYDLTTANDISTGYNGLVWAIGRQDRTEYEADPDIKIGDNGWANWELDGTHYVFARDSKYVYYILYPNYPAYALGSQTYGASQARGLVLLLNFIQDNDLERNPDLEKNYQVICDWVQYLAEKNATS